jgi:hypothetical protein
MRLIHKSKDNFRVISKPICEFTPEFSELSGRGGGGVGGVADGGAGEGLRGGIVIPHVVCVGRG